jgi:FHA domain
MSLIGLDLNATRARAIQGENQGSSLRVPIALLLDGHERELPLALSLEGRQPQVGRAGTALCRKSPHLACLDFLPYLGDSRTWDAGRHRFDAARALAFACEHLQYRLGKAEGVTVALPAYFSPAQAALLANLAGKARWQLLGSVPSPLAIALAAHEHLPWSGLAVVVDLDGHALSWSAVTVREDVLRVRYSHPATHLARGDWLCRLLNCVADRCVRLSRRDPRESAEIEQGLYDQLVSLLETHQGDEPAEVVIQTPHWYQHLIFPPAELSAFCAPLVQQAVAEMQSFLAATAPIGPIGVVLLSSAAARLPGLAAALEGLILLPESEPPHEEDPDFGEDLIEENMLSVRVHVLDDDAVARAAFDLALRQHKGELPRGHLDAAPLPGTSAADASSDRGPARLHFRGADYLLSGPLFILGREPSCNLIFETELYPTVSARHCEIVFRRGAYLLRDRSRHGTLVNDCLVTQPVALHSGDWIRLGPGGPLVRFLGQANDQRHVMTIA